MHVDHTSPLTYTFTSNSGHTTAYCYRTEETLERGLPDTDTLLGWVGGAVVTAEIFMKVFRRMKPSGNYL